MVRTQVQLTPNQIKDLKHLSATTGQSVAELVRQGVDQLLASKKQPSREELWARALRALGRFHSGYTDVGKEHDRHLAEIYYDDIRGHVRPVRASRQR